MSEQDHGLHVEPLPRRRPNGARPPASRAVTQGAVAHLHDLDPKAQRSVAALLAGQHPAVRAAIESTYDDSDADRAGAT